MNSNQETSRRKITAFFKMVLAVWAVSVGGQVALGQNLITNGDFADGLNGWKSAGDVTAPLGRAVMKDNGTDAVLYQGIAVSGYAYELRFNAHLDGLSNDAGIGNFDSVRLILYEGTDAATLGPDNFDRESVLIEGNASGLTGLVPRASIVPNQGLGVNVVSVVVEFTSEMAAIAPAVKLFNLNGEMDSEIELSDVRLIAVDRGRLANISNRGSVGTGPDRMIASFVLVGPNKKGVVVRGAGPWLGDLGVGGFLPNPSMQLVVPGNPATTLASNDDWETGNNVSELVAAMTKVGAWVIPFKTGSLDAGLFYNADGGVSAGKYSVVIEGKTTGPGGATYLPTGIAIAEVYDYGVSEDGDTELTNISNRGKTAKGAGAQIPGFVISGSRGRVVLIRAVGPSLAQFIGGTLDDPVLDLFQTGVEGPIATNDDYYLAENAAEIADAASRVGAFPLLANAKDGAILTGLQPGIYTAQANVKGDESGIVLVEVYVVTDNTRPVAATHTVFVSTAGSTTLPMDIILSPLQDNEGDALSIASYTQPSEGSITLDPDTGELEFTNENFFTGQTLFFYTLTDGELESATSTIGLNVAPPGAQIWTGEGGNSNFSNPDNWKGGQVPGTNDDVWIVTQGQSTINLNEDAAVKSLRIGGIGSEVEFKTSFRTLTTTGGMLVARGSTLDISGGTVNTGQDLSIGGTLKWSSGYMDGSASTIIEEGATAELSSTVLRLTGNRKFINRGTVVQTGFSALYAEGGSNSDVINSQGALWDLKSNANATFAYNDGSSILSFTNAGMLKKSVATGLVTFGTRSGTSNFTNSATGTVMIEGGSFALNGNGSGSHAGAIDVASGAEMIFQFGSHTVSSGATITDVGDIVISGASVTVDEAFTFESLKITNGTLVANGDLTVGTFEHTGSYSNSVFDSDNNLTVTSDFTWNGGLHTGSGTTIVADTATGKNTTGWNYLRGNHGFINRGAFQLSGGQGFYTDQGSQSTITNAEGATWDLNSTQRFMYQDNSSTLTFVNAGIFEKKNTTGIAYFGNSSGTTNFTNNGTVSVLGGTLQFDGGGLNEHNGELSIASGATILLAVGSHDFASGATVSEVGTLEVTGGNTGVTFEDAITLESFKISNGTVTANSAVTVGTFQHTNGIFNSSEPLTVTKEMSISGGGQTGDGTTTLGVDATGNFTGSQYALREGRNFTNLGEVNQSGNSHFRAMNGSNSTVTNGEGATWTTTSSNGTAFIYLDNSSTITFVNAGTYTKANATGLTYIGWATGTTNVTNTGTIEVKGGTLQFQGLGTGTHSGDLNIASSGTVIFQNGTHTFDGDSTVTNTGTFQVNGNNTSVTFADGFEIDSLSVAQGNLILSGALTVGSFSQTNGTVTGSDDMTVTESFSWTNGAQAGSGNTILGPDCTATLTAGQHNLEGNRGFINMGEVNQSGTSLFYPRGGSGSTITNADGATWNLSLSDNRYYAYSDNSSTLDFVNEGVLAKVNASGRVNFGTTSGTQNFTNAATGEISIGGGEFWFRNRLGSGTYNGAVTLGATGSLIFNEGNHTFAAGAAITGDGKLTVESNQATVTLTDAYTLKTVQIKNGTLNSVGALTAANFTHTNGVFSSSADLTVTDTLLINGGNPRHSGSGTTIIADGATGNLTSGDLFLNGGRNFTNNGEVTQSGNMTIRTELGTSSTITNPLGRTWTLNDQNGNYFAHADNSSQLTFDNAGTLIRTSSGTTNFGWQGSTVLNNTGIMDFSTVPGSLYLRSTSVANFGSSSVLTVKMSASTVAVQGDTIANFDGSLILIYDGTPPSGQAIRTFNYDARNGSSFNTITPPQGASIGTINYDDTSNNGRLEITFN